ncbi:MAG: winged helix-turn-helix domain-containing protein, partial [Actinomycetia bacterium]|nr:winged helix-turn-helix domain-containing protein [Actinomycetes bacterium]
MTVAAVGGSAPLIGVLGPMTIRRDGADRPVPGRLDRAVLAHLVLAERRAVSLDALIDALWPDQPPARARNAVQVKVSRLRGLLGEHAGLLRYEQGAYRLSVEPDQVDAGRLAARVDAAEDLLRAGAHAAAADLLAPVLAAWRGRPLADLDDHPRIVSARLRFGELRLRATEAYAEARLADPAGRAVAIADLRALLDRDPLRPRARLALMRGLDLDGRRADALAVYDAGRRMFAQLAGLEPPQELRMAFEELLDRERRATRQAKIAGHVPRVGPQGLLETVRWVADDGDTDAAMQLAVRGAWWWWIGGQRTRAAELFEDLLERSAADGHHDGVTMLGALAWAGVFGAMDAGAERALTAAEGALHRPRRPAWTGRDALAAVLIAERRFARGEPDGAHRLLEPAVRHYARESDEWGQALCVAVHARGRLLSGDVAGAEQAVRAQLRTFVELADSAGQVMSLDILGYCAEVRGDLPAAARTHARALDLARRA